MSEVSKFGIPILSMQQKLKALAYCIEEKAYEDAAGHLCDLLSHCGKRIETDKFPTLEKLVAYYGRNPTLIK